MELNKIKEAVSKEINLTETEEEKNRRYKAMPRKVVDWFLSCLKKLGVESKNIKYNKSLVAFLKFSGSLYDLVHITEIASDEDFNCINLFIKEAEGLYKNISDFKSGVNAYLKLDSAFYEESINKIKFYWDLVKEHFIYGKKESVILGYDTAIFSTKNVNNDYKSIIKGFSSILELMIYNQLKKESLDKIDKFIKILGLDNEYYYCFLKALHSFIDELCKTEKHIKLIELIDVLPDAIKEIKNSIKIFNLLQINNGIKKATGVFKSDREFYIRYINIILLKSVLTSFERNIDKFSEGNKIISKRMKQMLIIILQTKMVKQYLSKLFTSDKTTEKILNRIFYSLVKNKPIDESFYFRFIYSCCKTDEHRKPELSDVDQNDFCK